MEQRLAGMQPVPCHGQQGNWLRRVDLRAHQAQQLNDHGTRIAGRVRAIDGRWNMGAILMQLNDLAHRHSLLVWSRLRDA
jgi:hypothetical protein